MLDFSSYTCKRQLLLSVKLNMPRPGKQILNYISRVTITMRGLCSKDTSTNLEFSEVLSAV